jgi:hypothetical protein
MPAVVLLLVLGCKPEQPVTVDNPTLGIKVAFPGPPVQVMYSETTPLGDILWYNLTYDPKMKINAANMHVDVGGPVLKDVAGVSPQGMLAGFQKHLRERLGAITVEALPAERGPGFHYTAQRINERIIEGIVILRRGRFHHAQGASGKPGDPALQAFLDSFEVAR